MDEYKSKQCKASSNIPHDGDAVSIMLEAMSAAELTYALEDALENMTEENYDPALIEAYLDALDRKEPMPDSLEAKTSYACFQKQLQRIIPECNTGTTVHSRAFYRAWRVGLVAVIAIITMMGAMVVAQAAGVDVFGAMARWTGEVFSLGTIRSHGAVDTSSVYEQPASGVNDAIEFESLQAALDAYDITEIAEPSWIPAGYILDNIDTLCLSDGTLWVLSAAYTNGTDYLNFGVNRYRDHPSSQIEKNDTPVETFEVNGLQVYLLENTNNNTAAWATEHYEYCVSGVVDKSTLQNIVLSAYVDVQ